MLFGFRVYGIASIKGIVEYIYFLFIYRYLVYEIVGGKTKMIIL